MPNSNSFTNTVHVSTQLMSTIFTKGRHRRHLIDQVQLTRPPFRTRDRNGQSTATLHYSLGRKQPKISPTRLQLVYCGMRLIPLDIKLSFHPSDQLISSGIDCYNIPRVLRVNLTNHTTYYRNLHGVSTHIKGALRSTPPSTIAYFLFLYHLPSIPVSPTLSSTFPLLCSGPKQNLGVREYL